MNLHDLALYQAMNGEAEPSVTVEPLEVTENGEYSEEGKAYSPVTVNIEPIVSSAHIMIENKTNATATYMGGTEMVVSDGAVKLIRKSYNLPANGAKVEIEVPYYSSAYSTSRPNAVYLYGVINIINNKFSSSSVVMSVSEGTITYGEAPLNILSMYSFAFFVQATNPSNEIVLSISLNVS